MRKKVPVKKDAIEITKIIFLSSSVLLLIFSILFASLIKFKTKEEISRLKKGSNCIISGCNGEICQDKDKKPTMTICVYKPEYECYKQAICEVQEDGNCGWTETKEFQECINKIEKE